VQRDELAAWLRLTGCPGVGAHTARQLLATFGLPQDILAQRQAALAAVAGPGVAAALLQPSQAEAKATDDLIERTWAWLHAGPSASLAPSTPSAPSAQRPVLRRVITLADADYPAALLRVDDPPVLLYAMGQLAAPLVWPGLRGMDEPMQAAAPAGLAMVGSRSPTAQGEAHARAFAHELAARGVVIVSGLAAGIDGAAHEGALSAAAQRSAEDVDLGWATIAVVGTGLDRVYPARHRALAHAICQQGVVLSEYAIGTPPIASNFPRRNRILSGLSRGVLVVEAALQSGSLITARMALEQGREVMAIPGSIHSPLSRGCHALIRQGARLVETAQDVLEELGLAPLQPAGSAPAPRQRRRVPVDASAQPGATKNIAGIGTDTPQEPQMLANAPGSAVGGVSAPAPDDADADTRWADVLQGLGWDPIDLDTLQARTGRDTGSLQVALLELELAGHVGRLAGGWFQRLALA
jgi:DNA processing protein